MFIQNKYHQWYCNIIAAAKKLQRDGYVERHHIVPKSLGGSNIKENLVALTFREHYVCHRLLPFFTKGNDRKKMLRALWAMTLKHGWHKRTLSSRQYEICKKACSEAASLYRHSEESKRKIGIGNSKPKSAQHRKSIGLSSKGRQWSATSKKKQSDKMTGAGNVRAKAWRIETPNGKVEIISCLKAWCKQNNFPYSSMGNTVNIPNYFYKGFRASKVV